MITKFLAMFVLFLFLVTTALMTFAEWLRRRERR